MKICFDCSKQHAKKAAHMLLACPELVKGRPASAFSSACDYLGFLTFALPSQIHYTTRHF